jgi:2-(1,2-epoxy-1,2-dihydrophenyl)acetyl-CoA isomerase
MSSEIEVRRTASGVATVVINRPDRRNSLAGDTMTELSETLRALGADSDVQAVVLTGDRGAFCSGIDIGWLTAIPRERIIDEGVAFYDLPQSMVRALLALPVPTIAAIDGPAVGLGLDIALACDSRLIGPEGWLRQGWGGAGLIPATGGVLTLSRVAPGGLWRLLDGQPKIAAEEAERLSLGEAAAPTGLLAAMTRAETLAAMSPTALRGYVELSREAVRANLDAHLARAAEIQLSLFAEGGYRQSLASKISRTDSGSG